MFDMFMPFFAPDDATGGETPEVSTLDTGDWRELFKSMAVDEDQPEAESETPEEEEATETDDTLEAQEEVEPTADEEASDDQDSFNDDTEIDLGEGRQPVKLSELKAGFLRQSDYTKKTQALADERKAFETEREEVQPYKEWMDYWNQNPWLLQQLDQAVQTWQKTGQIDVEEIMQDAGYAKYLNHYMAENTRLKKELDSIKGEYETTKLSTSMNTLVSDLKAEYGDLVTPEYETKLRDRAKEQGLSTDVIKEIAEGHLSKQQLQQEKAKAKKVTKETEANTIQKLQEKRTSLPPQPKSTGQRPQTPTKSVEDMDWLEIMRSSAQ
jgi:hypothetical protein